MHIEDALILENKHTGSNYYALTLAAPQISAAARSGQFVMIAPAPGQEPFLKRPMGINVIDTTAGQIRLIYRLAGHGTRLLSGLAANAPVQVLGPLGNGWRVSGGQRALLVGGGSGIAPLLPLATELTQAGLACQVLLGANSAREFACVDDFARLCRVNTATLDGSLGVKGLVTQLLPEQPAAYDMIYCCGPRPLMHKVAIWSEQHSLPCQVSLEEHMGCGFGVCMGCVCSIKELGKQPGGTDEPVYKRVCCDGPVFDSREVAW